MNITISLNVCVCVGCEYASEYERKIYSWQFICVFGLVRVIRHFRNASVRYRKTKVENQNRKFYYFHKMIDCVISVIKPWMKQSHWVNASSWLHKIIPISNMKYTKITLNIQSMQYNSPQTIINQDLFPIPVFHLNNKLIHKLYTTILQHDIWVMSCHQ